MPTKKQPRHDGKQAPPRPPNPRKPAGSSSPFVDDSRRQARERSLEGPARRSRRDEREQRELTRDRRHDTREPRLHSR